MRVFNFVSVIFKLIVSPSVSADIIGPLRGVRASGVFKVVRPDWLPRAGVCRWFSCGWALKWLQETKARLKAWTMSKIGSWVIVKFHFHIQVECLEMTNEARMGRQRFRKCIIF